MLWLSNVLQQLIFELGKVTCFWTYVLLCNPQKIDSFTISASLLCCPPQFISSPTDVLHANIVRFSLTLMPSFTYALPCSPFFFLNYFFNIHLTFYICYVSFPSPLKISSRKEKLKPRKLQSFMRLSDKTRPRHPCPCPCGCIRSK